MISPVVLSATAVSPLYQLQPNPRRPPTPRPHGSAAHTLPGRAQPGGRGCTTGEQTALQGQGVRPGPAVVLQIARRGAAAASPARRFSGRACQRELDGTAPDGGPGRGTVAAHRGRRPAVQDHEPPQRARARAGEPGPPQLARCDAQRRDLARHLRASGHTVAYFLNKSNKIYS